MPLRRRLLFGLIVFVAVLAVVEIVSYGMARVLAGRGLCYTPQDLDGFAVYLEDRHPTLGWLVNRNEGDDELDASGSRLVPAFPEPHGACVSLYGDSMTWAQEVDAEHSWANVLARSLDCRVANYGIGGYGTDQAFLRFRHNQGRDEAPVVVLGHLAENILRNVNQYRRLLYTRSRYGLKPRFVLDGAGELQLIPPLLPDEDEYRRLTRDPSPFLEYEYFRPGEQIARLGFPYTWTALATFGNFRVRAKLAGRPAHTEFYDPGHPSRALQVTAAVLAAFDAEARAAERRPLPLAIPTGGDFEYFLLTGEWTYQPLVDLLAERGIEMFNAGPPMLAALEDGRHPCELVFQDCAAHFTEEGYALLAGAVQEELERRGYIPGSQAAARARGR